MSSPPPRESLLTQIRDLDNRFWIVNVMEMFERLAYYGVRAVVAIYMVLAVELGGPEFDHVQKGAIFAAWAAVQSVLPMFTGGFADRYGHKRTIAVAIVTKVLGYGMMATFKSYGLFFVGCVLLAAGTAIFKPGVQGTLAATLKKSSASVGWGIFYQLVNVGGFLGPVLAGVLRLMDWSYVFWACAAIVSINFLWLPFYKDPTQEVAEADPEGSEHAQRASWSLISRAVSLRNARAWATGFGLVTALWFVLQFDGALGLVGGALGVAMAAAVWRAPRLGAALSVGLLVASVLLTFLGQVDSAQAVLEATGGGRASAAFVLKYLSWAGLVIAPALFLFCAGKARYDEGRTDPLSIYVVSVSGLFQPRVLTFCLVFSGFWLMFNQVFDLLPNVIDDWVDSSGIILTLGHAFSSAAIPTALALALGTLYGGVCAVGVWLAMRPDHRTTAEVPRAAYAVVAIALAGAAWFPLDVAFGQPWTLLALALGPLLALAAREARVPANSLALAAAAPAALGAIWWTRALLLGSAGTLVEMAERGEQVNPEWMVNLNPGLIVFTMIFFAWLSGFVRPLTSIMVGMVIATVGSVLAGTATVGWICLFGILVFSVGEMLSSPKKMEYLATLSPKGSEGLFMGYVNIPLAIGWISGSIFAGNRYEEHGDKVNLARRHLVEVVGMDPDAVAALQKTDVMPTLADRLGLAVSDAQHLLFETYHPEAIWLDIGLIGAVSFVGMLIYDRVIRAVDRKAAEDAAA